MNIENINMYLFLILDSIHQIESPKISMFAVNDRYTLPPYLRFRFKGLQHSHPIYLKLIHAVETFEGSVSWEIVRHTSNSFVLLPSLFHRFWMEGKFERNAIESVLGDRYSEAIDWSISDIIRLGDHIKDCGAKFKGITA